VKRIFLFIFTLLLTGCEPAGKWVPAGASPEITKQIIDAGIIYNRQIMVGFGFFAMLASIVGIAILYHPIAKKLVDDWADERKSK
jgi:hypothetical protein